MGIKKIFLAINILLLVILTTVGLSTIRLLYKADTEAHPVEEIEECGLLSLQPATEPLTHYLAVIEERRLFGSPPLDIDEEMPPETLPRTELKLRLVGTIYSSPLLSRAIIEDLSTGKKSLYRLGDIVAGAKIVRIKRNEIVLEREGVQEVLIMAHYEGGMLAKERFELPHLQSVLLSEREITAATEAASRIMEKLDPQKEVLPDIMEVVNAVNDVLRCARISPHFSEGRLRGIRLTDIYPGSIYERIGLEPGDIIKIVNGHRVNSVQGILQIYNEIYQYPTVTISVDRGGRILTLVYKD
jgi:general secretion pathway protein C